MLGAVVQFFDFVWKAVQTYAASEEGRAELNDILNELEAAGIDVPFYEPQGERGSVGVQDFDMGQDGGEPRGSTFRERHPELFKKEGKQ